MSRSTPEYAVNTPAVNIQGELSLHQAAANEESYRRNSYVARRLHRRQCGKTRLADG